MSSESFARRCGRILLPALLTAGLLIGACGGADDPLLIYSGRGEELVGPLIEEFRRSSGLEVEVRYAGSTELASTLLEEGSGTEADVFLAQDPASLGLAAPLLATLPSEVVEAVPPRFRDRDQRWVGVSGRIRTIVYDRDQVLVSDLPAGIDDLLDPRWTGMIGVAPTNGSFLAFVAAMILDRGEAATLDWLKELAALDPLDYPKNSPIVAAADAGEVGLGLVNHYYLLRLQAEGGGKRAANHFLSAGDPGSLVMPSGVGVLSGSDQSEDAHRFIEFLLSETAQRHFAEQTYEYPLAAGVRPAASLPPIDTIPTPRIDLSDLHTALERATDLVAEAGLL
ncbi:MAG: iron ABC transporter substrate-binding protein [bacterium]|nr:iron ABC transporter substrate-binding protein [bacterium]MDE0600421.1 iron ABC transporter substrate-binding protein [bacterium]